jgi:hypothetical protein
MAEQLGSIKHFKPIEDGFTKFLDEQFEFTESQHTNNFKIKDPNQVKSIAEMIACLENNPDTQLDARVIAYNEKTHEYGIKKLDKKSFLECLKGETKDIASVNLKEAKYVDLSKVRLREGVDSFATDSGTGDGPTLGLIGEDFVPLLGGPFYKQLYFYDYMRQANAAFYCQNHDPIAHQAVRVIKDFTLGRGFRVDSDNDAAMILWAAFEKANDLQKQYDQMATELSINGEVMWWWLPDNEAKIYQAMGPMDKIKKAALPRVRLLDATVFWEIVTEPTDITEVLYYVWVAPTQWQMYTGLEGHTMTPSAKFIFQTITADQIDHYKVNAFSNEKRGRSDLFPVLGFLKRLRDSVNYSLISLQKQAAWGIDTSIEGNQDDINAYLSDMAALGTIAPAGSEFVHSAKIKREYKGVEGTGKGGGNVTFEWAFSMVAAGLGIPISYFGSHLSGGQTKASAIVATEPVAKRFEARQKIYEESIHRLWDRLMEWAGIDAECEVTFPEIVTADRTQKLQDLALGENMEWWDKERAATTAAKEMNFNDYVYEVEQDEIAKAGQQPAITSPLTALGLAPAAPAPKAAPASNTSMSTNQKTEIKKNNGQG